MLNLGSRHRISISDLLRGEYEVDVPSNYPPSDWQVPDFGYNVMNMMSLLYQPWVDRQYLDSGFAKPSWPENKPFAVCLTHDVDAVSMNNWRQIWRGRRNDYVCNKTRLNLARCYLGFMKDMTTGRVRLHSEDALHLHCCHKWLMAERNIGARSTFFFFPEKVTKAHITDCRYHFDDRVVFDGKDCSVRDMIKEIDRMGWEIGLHPSWYTFNDLDELKRQKEQIERILGHDIVSVRQHYLHYDIKTTPGIQASSGLRYDSTLGFNNNIGFRFGTSYPWRLPTIDKDDKLSILEVPLIIQGAAMLSLTDGLRLDEDTAFRYVVQITEEVSSVGGVLTLLWHPNNIDIPHYWNLYLRTLEYVNGKNAWIASLGEIGEWWLTKNNQNQYRPD